MICEKLKALDSSGELHIIIPLWQRYKYAHWIRASISHSPISNSNKVHQLRQLKRFQNSMACKIAICKLKHKVCDDASLDS